MKILIIIWLLLIVACILEAIFFTKFKEDL